MHASKQRPFTPKYMSVDETCDVYGLRLSKLYQLIRDGNIRTVKLGRRRLVEVASVEQLFGGHAA